MRKLLAAGLAGLLLSTALAAPAFAQAARAAQERASEKVNKLLEKAQEAYAAGDYQGAVDAFTQAIETGDLPDGLVKSVHLNRAISYYNLKQFTPAVADFDKVIELDPSEAQAYAGRGQCRFELKQNDLAIADLKQAVALKPDDASFAGALCTIAFNSRVMAEAGPACERYLAFEPANQEIMRAAAQAYEAAGNKPKAAEMWGRLLAAVPGLQEAQDGVKRNSAP